MAAQGSAVSFLGSGTAGGLLAGLKGGIARVQVDLERTRTSGRSDTPQRRTDMQHTDTGNMGLGAVTMLKSSRRWLGTQMEMLKIINIKKIVHSLNIYRTPNSYYKS